MKTLNLILVVIVLSAVSCQNNPPVTEAMLIPETNLKVKDGIFIHVSKGYNNPQKVLMALSIATKMTETQDVALFFIETLTRAVYEPDDPLKGSYEDFGL